MFNNPCKVACWYSFSLPFGVGIVEVTNGGGNVHPRLILGGDDQGWSRVNLL